MNKLKEPSGSFFLLYMYMYYLYKKVHVHLSISPIAKYMYMYYNKTIEKEQRTEKQEVTTMKKFEVGKSYATNSACDHNCVWTFTVTARTACTVTLVDDHGETIKRRISKQISEWRKAESIMPNGNYSMAPILSATDETTVPRVEAEKAQRREAEEAETLRLRNLRPQREPAQQAPILPTGRVLYLADYR